MSETTINYTWCREDVIFHVQITSSNYLRSHFWPTTSTPALPYAPAGNSEGFARKIGRLESAHTYRIYYIYTSTLYICLPDVRLSMSRHLNENERRRPTTPVRHHDPDDHHRSIAMRAMHTCPFKIYKKKGFFNFGAIVLACFPLRIDGVWFNLRLKQLWAADSRAASATQTGFSSFLATNLNC